MDESQSHICVQLTKLLYYLKYITVEPTMAMYMMAFMTTSVVEQAFYVYKTCTVNHGYNSTVCNNLSDYKNILKEVQVSFCSSLGHKYLC